MTVREDTPFGQYWGLKSIGRVLAVAPREATGGVKDQLLALAARTPPGTDRDYELKGLLRQIDQEGCE